MDDDDVPMDIVPWEVYRNSAVGISLTNALNSMLDRNELTVEQALLVLDEYDRMFQFKLRDNLVLDGSLREMNILVSILSIRSIRLYLRH